MARSLRQRRAAPWGAWRDFRLTVAGHLLAGKINNTYKVLIGHEEWDGVAWTHLSISRIDGAPRHDWSDFQRIKNELLGPTWEGVEFYPPASDLVDLTNAYHLYCCEGRVPIACNPKGRANA